MPEGNASLNLTTGRGVDGDGNIVIPGFCEIETLQISNRYGAWIDISSLVLEFNIFYDLYSPVLKGNIKIRDNVNLFQGMQFNGSEELRVIINIEPNKDGVKNANSNDVVLIFHTEKYTRLEKTQEVINVQEIHVDLVCRTAYASKLSRVCKGLRFQDGMMGTDPYIEIEEIWKKLTLNQESTGTSIYRDSGGQLQKMGEGNSRHENITRIQGNITNRSPLQAIEFLRTKCFDISFAPFFIYPSLTKKHEDTRGREFNFISSLTDIAEENTNPTYYAPIRSGVWLPYKYTAGFTDKESGDPGSDSYYDNQKVKIISLNTNMEMSMLDQAAEGGFGNCVQIVDYLRKDMISKQMNPGFDAAPPGWVINDFKLPEESLTGRGVPFSNILFDGKSISIGGGPGFNDGNQNNNELFEQSKSLIHLPATQTLHPEISSSLAYDADTISQPEEDGAAPNQFIANRLGITAQEHLPSGELDMQFRTAPELYAQGLNMMKYYSAIMDNRQSLEISVHGDIHLNPGVKIEIEIPLSAQLKDDSESGLTIDENLSGIYLIVGVSHSFKTGVYMTRCKIIKLRDRPASEIERGESTGGPTGEGILSVLKHWYSSTNGEYIPANSASKTIQNFVPGKTTAR